MSLARSLASPPAPITAHLHAITCGWWQEPGAQKRCHQVEELVRRTMAERVHHRFVGRPSVVVPFSRFRTFSS